MLNRKTVIDPKTSEGGRNMLPEIRTSGDIYRYRSGFVFGQVGSGKKPQGVFVAP